jgi:5-methylthioribose kinase
VGRSTISHGDADVGLLTRLTVESYLESRGLLPAGSAAEVTELGGGISNVVLGVESAERSCVVKQSLPRLRVAEEWLAKRERAVTEARALALAASLIPGHVPRVLDLDADRYAFTIERAPPSWRAWKDDLLAGTVDAGVARRVASLLAAWHAGTRDDQAAEAFADREGFEQLRIDPYYRAVARAHPDLASTVEYHIEQLLRPGTCVVHGDYSPKNVLVGESGLWIIDFEVAHFGNPTFDLAFMLNHLLLKAVHAPAGADGYLLCARTFWETYAAEIPRDLEPDEAATLGQVGCLMVARVDGKSPAEYLREPERDRARALGRRVLTESPRRLDEALRLVRA